MESMKAKNQTLPIWQSMIHPFMNVWMLINGINKKQCVYCDIGYCRIGEKDGMMIHVRWQCEVIMKWFEMIECGSFKSSIQSVLKDVVSVILVLVTLVSRSKILNRDCS